MNIYFRRYKDEFGKNSGFAKVLKNEEKYIYEYSKKVIQEDITIEESLKELQKLIFDFDKLIKKIHKEIIQKIMEGQFPANIAKNLLLTESKPLKGYIEKFKKILELKGFKENSELKHYLKLYLERAEDLSKNIKKFSEIPSKNFAKFLQKEIKDLDNFLKKESHEDIVAQTSLEELKKRIYWLDNYIKRIYQEVIEKVMEGHVPGAKILINVYTLELEVRINEINKILKKKRIKESKKLKDYLKLYLKKVKNLLKNMRTLSKIM